MKENKFLTNRDAFVPELRVVATRPFMPDRTFGGVGKQSYGPLSRIGSWQKRRGRFPIVKSIPQRR